MAMRRFRRRITTIAMKMKKWILPATVFSFFGCFHQNHDFWCFCDHWPFPMLYSMTYQFVVCVWHSIPDETNVTWVNWFETDSWSIWSFLMMWTYHIRNSIQIRKMNWSENDGFMNKTQRHEKDSKDGFDWVWHGMVLSVLCILVIALKKRNMWPFHNWYMDNKMNDSTWKRT